MKFLKLILLILTTYALFGQTAPGKFWVKFTDKANNPYSISAPEQFLSQRAIDRREKYNIDIQTNDLPVTPMYVDSLKSMGIEIMHTSKWFNAATVKTNDTLLMDTISYLSFVQGSEKVYYYKRQNGIIHTVSRKPYIVKTRESDRLLSILKKDQHPIFFEGLHTTSILNHPDLAHRKKIVRTHNIEHQYYHHLYKNENKKIKRIFYEEEAKKLKKYEQVLKYASVIAAISKNDYQYFNSKYNT